MMFYGGIATTFFWVSKHVIILRTRVNEAMHASRVLLYTLLLYTVILERAAITCKAHVYHALPVIGALSSKNNNIFNAFTLR